jgi:hypothetical protein
VLFWKKPRSAVNEKIPVQQLTCANKIFGLNHSIISNNKVIYKMREYNMSNRIYYYNERMPFEMHAPLKAYTRKWSGCLNVPKADYYTLSIDSPFEKLIPDILLARGKHSVTVTQTFQKMAVVGKSDYIRLLIKKKGQKLPAEVGYGQLSPD